MIEITDVSKIYTSALSSKAALSKVSLTVGDGEMVAIMGKSGAGKSTLGHIVCGIDDYTEGDVKINGVSLSAVSEKQLAKIRNEVFGIVLQDFALVNSYTVEENVMIPLLFTKINPKQRKEKIDAALKMVDMTSFANQVCSKLSGGEKQRVAIARAIVNNPQIILADEPTGSLDSTNSTTIMDLLTEINKQGKTIIIITHDIDIANQCRRIITLSDGHIISDEIK